MTKQQIDQVVTDFLTVAALAGFPVRRDEIVVEFCSAPHKRPTRLPSGKMAVYVFFTETHCLKVGKAGAKSAARYIAHHYNTGSARSNLAKSVFEEGSNTRYWPSVISASSGELLGTWIEENTTRVNLLLDEGQSVLVLNLLEAFVQCRLRPVFEGKMIGSTGT